MTRLVHESVTRTIIKMAVPMLAGTFAINMYNLTNTWFVSRLGTAALAAISFAIPVIMFLMFVTRGLSSGAMTLVAHAIGRRDQQQATVLTTHALALAMVYAAMISTVGLLSTTAVFAQLGASGETLATVVRYMRVWYTGAAVMILQIVASDIIISTGNTKVISLLMVGSTVVNVLLDMGFIFGMFGLPKMGIVGAAVATILAQGTALAAALFMLVRKMKLIDLGVLAPRPVLRSWGRILKFGIPGALGMILTPISAAVITRLVSGYGDAAVAATGVAGRIEMFAFMVPMTVGMSLIPFVAQNYGAGRMDRIRKARRGAMTFAVLYGILIGLLFIAFAGPMAGVFSKEQAVVDILRTYIYITGMGYGMLEVHRYAGFAMTGAHEPIQATVLNVVRVVVLLIPLSMLGNALLQLRGIFWGRFTTDIVAGLVGVWWSGRILASRERGGAPSRIDQAAPSSESL